MPRPRGGRRTPHRRRRPSRLAFLYAHSLRALQRRTVELAASEARYRQVTESVRDIIFSLDAAGRITFINSRAERLLGARREELLGRSIPELVGAGVIASVAPGGSPVLPNPRTHLPRETVLRRRDGAEIVLEIEAEHAVGGEGGGGIHGIARDITQRRLMEERLRRSERLAALGQIVSRVGHELRKAVAGITASMEMARRSDRDGVLARELDSALSEATRARGIVQGLLGSTGEQQAALQPCSLEAAALSVIELRRSRLDALGISVSLGLTGPHPPVMADPDRLREVFHNIVDNAEHALGSLPMGRERRLGVRSWMGEGRVCVEVADTGPGIGQNDRARVFDPFFTTRAGGSGLGLAVSSAIIGAFGGDISVQSREGEGARFTVELPLGEWAPASAAARPVPDNTGARVLVAEDEPIVRDFIHRLMESLGCRVDSAANGEEAVALLARGTPYALVVSDYSMPDRDGRALYEWIRGSRPGLLDRIIYITGDSTNPATLRFLEECGVPYLLKPVAASTLADEARRVLGRAGGGGGARPGT
jgi:PAS domain S-box-containing protein